jgi:hypothetical protein
MSWLSVIFQAEGLNTVLKDIRESEKTTLLAGHVPDRLDCGRIHLATKHLRQPVVMVLLIVDVRAIGALLAKGNAALSYVDAVIVI